MAKLKKSRTPPKFGSLQAAVEDGLAALPLTYLENQIHRKLQQQVTKPPSGLARQIAEHLLSGDNKPFCADGEVSDLAVEITFGEEDMKELEANTAKFQEEHLPELLRSVSEDTATRTLGSLKAGWVTENELQKKDLDGFRERLLHRWDKPIGQLRMLITMVREWCREVHLREHVQAGSSGHETRILLIRMLVRGCQVADEILCLLENGFADGAMARWRTLHEIAVVAAVIYHYGDEIAERYREHQYVESKRAMDKYNACAPSLGYQPLGANQQKRIGDEYDRVIAAYGKSFRSDYGWSAHHLEKEKPTFADLEAVVGRAEMRSYYQMGNDNIHAGIKSMYVRLGLIGAYDGLLSGRSNAGLTDPGQNTAHTLTQLAVLICGAHPTFDDNIISLILCDLRDEIPSSFSVVDAQIDAEETEKASKTQRTGLRRRKA